MKILLNLLAATSGGQVTRAHAFVERFFREAPYDELIVIKRNGFLPKLVSFNNVNVIEVSLPAGQFGVLSRLFWENTILHLFIQRNAIDRYLTFSHYLPIVNISIPNIIAVSNLAPFSADAIALESGLSKLRLVFLKRTILSSALKADSVIALSKECKKILVSYRVPSKKISVIYNGVNGNHTHLVSDKIDAINPSSKYILSVSHFYKYKNYEQILRAYASLPSGVKDEYRLLLVGKFIDRDYVKKIKFLSIELGIQCYVDFIPGLDSEELNVVYQSSDLFLFSSLIENSPNILLEAMSHGLPILSINLPPMPEFGGSAVIYFNKGDVHDLANSIMFILSEEKSSDLLRKKAIAQSKLFTWEYFTKHVIQLCYDV